MAVKSPGMTWTKGITGGQQNGLWTIDMPEGNYSYKLAIRHPNGLLKAEQREARQYRFSQDQDVITFN